ncbi:MAG TPA: hypothetical protein VF424_09725, partial [Vicinamibacterales bacterium]
MAAGTVIFSVVDGVALRPLPFGSPQRLVSLWSPSTAPGSLLPATPRHYFDWLEGARAFESLGAARLVAPLRLDVDGIIETVT